MEMKIVHADAERKEIRHVKAFEKLDSQVSIAPKAALLDNSWELIVSAETWEIAPIEVGHYIYISDTEWGGPVECLQHNTSSGTITLSGPIWRGMLMRKVVVPPAEAAYFDITDEANAVILAVVGSKFGDLFTVSTEDTETEVTGHWRYTQMHSGLESALEAAGMMLSIVYSAEQKSVILSARTIVDHSPGMELSQDYGIDLKAYSGRIDRYNHVIALGAGELVDRDVMHVYMLADGSTTTTPPEWAGSAVDVEMIYDFNNPENTEELLEGAVEKLIEHKPQQGVEVDPGDTDIDLPLGDYIGARDRVTGLYGKAQILEKILTIDEGGIKIDTKVG